MPITSRSISWVLLWKLLSWNGSPDVVWRIAKERQQGRVVEVLVARIPDEPVSQFLEVAQQRVEAIFGCGWVGHGWVSWRLGRVWIA